MIKRTLSFENPAYLSTVNGQLVIKLPDVEKNDLPAFLKTNATRTVPIEDIGLMLLNNKQITLTQGLIAALLQNNVAIISCDSSQMPVGIMLPIVGHSEQTEHFRNQIYASLPLKKQLWQQTIKCKIRNQARLLHHLRHSDKLLTWDEKVKSGDIENLEAQAAAVYWENFFPNLPDFRRDRDGIPPNNILNYGYAILRATIARAIVAAGMMPSFGIFHRNKYNAFCLADDLMEPYRPYVDLAVAEIAQSSADFSTITVDIKRELLKIPAFDVDISGKKRPLMVAATESAAGLYKCYAGEARIIPYPVFSAT